MWIKSQNSEELRPDDFYQNDKGVIIRRNFIFIEQQGEEQPAHWEYEEWQMTKKQYDIYLAQQAEVDFLTMESESMEEDIEQAKADIDYLLMITEEE